MMQQDLTLKGFDPMQRDVPHGGVEHPSVSATATQVSMLKAATNHHPFWHCLQDLLDAVSDIKSIPLWGSSLLTIVFVCSNVAMSLIVTDLGQVLHMIGGTAAR